MPILPLALAAVTIAPAAEPLWELVPMQRFSWTTIGQFTIAEDGEISGCTHEDFGTPGAAKSDGCADIRRFPLELRSHMRGTFKGPVTIMFRFQHDVAGVPMPPTPPVPGGFRSVTEQRTIFEISKTGKVSRCRFEITPVPPPGAPSPCGQLSDYAPGPGPVTVTITQSVMRRGGGAKP